MFFTDLNNKIFRGYKINPLFNLPTLPINNELDLKIKIAIMKTLTIGNFTEFVLSNEEMINVRGGNGAKNDTGDPTRPPVVIEI